MGAVLSLVGSYLVFFVLLYGYEKAVQRLDPVLRMAHTWELPREEVRPKKRHLRRVK